jgi:hypothetical protein
MLIRYNQKDLPPLCWPVAGQPWTWADAQEVIDAIYTLYNAGAFDDFIVDGSSCQQAWCGGSTSVWICNDVSSFGISSSYYY